MSTFSPPLTDELQQLQMEFQEILPAAIRSNISKQITTGHWTYTNISTLDYSQRLSPALFYQQPLLEDYPATIATPVETIDPRMLTINSPSHHNHLYTITSRQAAYLGLPTAHPAAFSSDGTLDLHANITARETASEASSTASPTQMKSTFASRSLPKSSSKSVQCLRCLRRFDRKSRAKACENRHKGIKNYPCSGACGNANCYALCQLRRLC